MVEYDILWIEMDGCFMTIGYFIDSVLLYAIYWVTMSSMEQFWCSWLNCSVHQSTIFRTNVVLFIAHFVWGDKTNHQFRPFAGLLGTLESGWVVEIIDLHWRTVFGKKQIQKSLLHFPSWDELAITAFTPFWITLHLKLFIYSNYCSIF